MLVLSRKCGEKIVIDGDITITIVATAGNKVKIGIEAPPHVSILRSELADAQPVVNLTASEAATPKAVLPPSPDALVAEQSPSSRPSRKAPLHKSLLHKRMQSSLRDLRQIPR